ncbi:Asp-tRNA(Asn)/Glu-tRNA(Gln) amidotransferase GatCAB subunit A, partial [Patescibacteria group bacterium]|nr:Asp-tRNA(Asn)/Glu-tRNA(Gln) amidotransferase GatCAB subunit A [Patescibacteria group bacterium]
TVNLAGVPSLNIPCGFVNKLPIGMQLIGPQLSEELLLQVGYTYQQETDWHERRPNVAY